MISTSRSGRLVVLALALVASVLAYVVPAQAAAPKATFTHVHVADGPTGVVLTANVSSRSGVPVGTVTFTGPDGPDPLGAPVAVDATGQATLALPDASGSPFGYGAQFTGADGWAASSGTVNPFGDSVKMTPVGTILHVGGPGLLKILTQTFGAKVSYAADGAPATGETIIFTQKNKAHGASGHPEMDPRYVYPVTVCEAVVDATGYATCTAEAPMASLVTLLTTPAWANHEVFPVMESTYLPIIGLG